MYFSFFKPQDWRKRSVVRGRGIYSEVPRFLPGCGRTAPVPVRPARQSGLCRVALCRVGVRRIDQPVCAQSTIRLGHEPDAHQIRAVLRTHGHGHIPPAGLAQPAARVHLPAALRAGVFVCAHGSQRLRFVGVAMVDLTRETAGKLRAVEAVFMLLCRLPVGFDPFGEAEATANQRRGRRRQARRAPGGSARCPSAPVLFSGRAATLRRRSVR